MPRSSATTVLRSTTTSSYPHLTQRDAERDFLKWAKVWSAGQLQSTYFDKWGDEVTIDFGYEACAVTRTNGARGLLDLVYAITDFEPDQKELLLIAMGAMSRFCPTALKDLEDEVDQVLATGDA